MTFRRVRIPARGGDRGLILKGLFFMFLSKFKEKTELFEVHLRTICTFCILHCAFLHFLSTWDSRGDDPSAACAFQRVAGTAG
jgi:hypothetical protein